VLEYEKRSRATGLTWPLPEDLDDDALSALVADRSTGDIAPASRPLPDVPYVLRELRKKHVTMQLLWTEYRTTHPDSYGYTQFCHYVNAARQVLEPTLRQIYRAGEKMLTDFVGDTIDLINKETGEVQPAYLFVAVLGASNYTYVHAVADMQEARWLGLHIRAFEYFGGVPEVVICDNPTTAVTKADRYEPILHPLFADMAGHYGTVILPALPENRETKTMLHTTLLSHD